MDFRVKADRATEKLEFIHRLRDLTDLLKFPFKGLVRVSSRTLRNPAL